MEILAALAPCKLVAAWVTFCKFQCIALLIIGKCMQMHKGRVSHIWLPGQAPQKSPPRDSQASAREGTKSSATEHFPPLREIFIRRRSRIQHLRRIRCWNVWSPDAAVHGKFHAQAIRR